MIVVEAKLIDHLKVNGGREYRAEVRFTYEYDGKDYESVTAALHGPLMFPLWNYEWQLLKKYKVGESYMGRLFPGNPRLAYLEIAPLSKMSVIGLPLVTIGYTIFMFGYWLVLIQWVFSNT
jgi:hypothetical protein